MKFEKFMLWLGRVAVIFGAVMYGEFIFFSEFELLTPNVYPYIIFHGLTYWLPVWILAYFVFRKQPKTN